MKKILCFLTPLFILAVSFSFSAMFGAIPKIISIDHKEYIESGFQDFVIGQDSLRRMYIGNQEGLLRYDGNNWEGFYLPNQSAIRALYCKNDTVFVGGFDEFGYFLPLRPGGRIVYHSLSDTLKTTVKNITEIRSICPFGGAIWFRADYWLFEYSGGRVLAFPSRQKLTAMAVYGGRLILAMGENGLSYFDKGKFEPIDVAALKGKYVVDMIPYEGKLLIATSNNGLYLLTGRNKVEPFHTKADPLIIGGNISKVTTDGSRIAFASLSKGLWILDISNDHLNIFNNRNGLKSNTVYTLFFDANHNLWAGSEDGLTLIVLNSPVNHLTVNGEKLGIGYAAIEIGDKIILGTSQGLFSVDASHEVHPMTQLSGYQPPVMSLALIGNELFVGTHDGLHILGKSGSQKVAGIPGTLHIHQLRSDGNVILLSTNDNFYLLEREGNRWVSRGKVSGYGDVNGRFAEDELGNIWISHWLKGVFRLRLAPDRKSFERIDLFTQSHGFPEDAGNTLAEVDGHVVFSTRSGIYRFDSAKGLFVPDSRLNALIPSNPSATLLQTEDGTTLSIAPGKIMLSELNNSGQLTTDSISFKSVLPDIVPGYVEMLHLENGELLVSTRNGFYSIDPRFKPTETEGKNSLYIDRITTPSDSVIYLKSVGATDDIRIKYKDNNLRFTASLPEYRERNAVLYSFWLKGYDRDWSQPGEQPTKEYTKLPPGDYVLNVKALNRYDDSECQTEFRFTIEAPWYLSTIMIIIYILLGIGALIGIAIYIKYASRRAAQKVKKREEEELRKVQQEAEMRRLEDQYQLEKLKSEQMEYNIRVKSEELSNTTMNVIRKNELLNSMIYKIRKTEEILGEKGYNSEARKNLNALRKLIAENIEHDDDWKKFTDNFDQVYDKFIKRLTTQFPTLTNSEVKICCYIKMGLSSKEISSIFNLSVRSIEMYRYQIRPKLGLGREDRLAVFLQQF